MFNKVNNSDNDRSFHICYCYHLYPAIDGGVELVIQRLAEYMVTKGYRVTVICSDVKKKGIKEEYIKGVHVIYVKSYFSIYKVPFTPKYLYTLLNIKPDLIHCHGTSPGFSDAPVIYAKLMGIPSLLTYHFDGNADGIVGNILSTVYNYTINSLVVRCADKITATGKSYADTSNVLRKVTNKVTIIPNGIDTQRFNTKYKDLKVNYNIPNGKIILWVGRFVKYKGLVYLIKAMKYVNGGTLLVIGTGKLEKYLRDLVIKEGLSKKVIFLGYIANKDLPFFYHKSYVYVLSSITRGENFGISSLEALGCGIPVIASELPGVKDLITKDVGITIVPKNSIILAKYINYLLKNKNIRNKMSVAAGKKAKLYSWNKVINQYHRLYKGLLKTTN